MRIRNRFHTTSPVLAILLASFSELTATLSYRGKEGVKRIEDKEWGLTYYKKRVNIFDGAGSTI